MRQAHLRKGARTGAGEGAQGAGWQHSDRVPRLQLTVAGPRAGMPCPLGSPPISNIFLYEYSTTLRPAAMTENGADWCITRVRRSGCARVTHGLCRTRRSRAFAAAAETSAAAIFARLRTREAHHARAAAHNSSLRRARPARGGGWECQAAPGPDTASQGEPVGSGQRLELPRTHSPRKRRWCCVKEVLVTKRPPPRVKQKPTRGAPSGLKLFGSAARETSRFKGRRPAIVRWAGWGLGEGRDGGSHSGKRAGGRSLRPERASASTAAGGVVRASPNI